MECVDERSPTIHFGQRQAAYNQNQNVQSDFPHRFIYLFFYITDMSLIYNLMGT